MFGQYVERRGDHALTRLFAPKHASATTITSRRRLAVCAVRMNRSTHALYGTAPILIQSRTMPLRLSRRVDGPAARRSALAAVLPTIGELACAHGFFGNLYEAIVRVPDRLSADYATIDGDRRLASLFSQGSPVRYFLPGVPIIIGSMFAALLTRSCDPSDRRWLGAAGSALFVSSALTAYLVPNVNVKLFVAGHPITAGDRDRLLRTWYRLNTIRIVGYVAGWLAFEKVRSDQTRR